MKVIVASFSKCGTKTLNKALCLLGYEVYDFLEHFLYLKEKWLKIFEDGRAIDEFQKMFLDVDAVCDVPSSFFWFELHQAFPDAKIIFTERESEDIWLKSFIKQIEKLPVASTTRKWVLKWLSPTARETENFFGKQLSLIFGFDVYSRRGRKRKMNETLLLKAYRRHNASVKQFAPRDGRTLFFNLKDGWRVLCKFLGKPVPLLPFPYENKSAEMVNEMIRLNYIDKIKSEIRQTACLVTCFVVCIFSLFIYVLKY